MVHYFVLMINFYQFLYINIRFFIKKILFLKQRIFQQPQDLEEVVLVGHRLLEHLNKVNLVPTLSTKRNLDLKKSIYDLEFENPLTFSSYESNIEILDLFFKLGIAGGCYKTMMKAKRSGNLRPRLQEIVYKGNKSLINAMGLPGLGAESAIHSILNSSLLSYKKPLGLSIGGESPDDYYNTFMIYENNISKLSYPFYYELNISCPNTDKGQLLTTNIALLEQLINKIRLKTNRVISIKLSPDQTDEHILQIAELVSQLNLMVINAGNTQFKTIREVNLSTKEISIGGGGLSGPYLFERTLSMIKLLKPFKLPLIATGGISTANQVNLCLQNGASLIGMATGLAFNPFTICKILKKLS